MQHVIQAQNIEKTFGREAFWNTNMKKVGVITRFANWLQLQETRRFLWLAISILGQIGLVLPLTLMAVVFAGGNNLGSWIIVCAVNVPVLVLNLAAQPMKVTIIALFIAWIVDAGVIIFSIAAFFTK